MISLTKLRVSMIGSIALVIGISTLILTVVLSLLTYDYDVSASSVLMLSLGFVVGIHFIQWLVSPWIIESLYKVKPVSSAGEAWVSEVIERVAKASGLRSVPKAMISEIGVPNAFAYGNVLSGHKVAVTRGLIENLPRDEVEAVIAHEVGHIKHRDVEIMMIISILPALIYWLGRLLLYSGFFTSGRSRDRGSAPILAVLAGMALVAVSFLTNLAVLYISRLREHYADTNAVLTVPEGGRRLQRALARILVASGSIKRFSPAAVKDATKLKALLISDPEVGLGSLRTYNIDEIVEWIKSQRSLSPAEVFSTHPDPAKRLRFIESLEREVTRRTLIRV
ncbi:MAG: zinc metalloprotease HtpX [Zestosphaera sp.]